MKTELRDGIYWLEKQERFDIHDFAVEVGCTCVLVLNTNDCNSSDTAFIYAFTKTYDADCRLVELARSENKYYCIDTAYVVDDCNIGEIM